MIFILALFAIRYALRYELTVNSGWHVNAALITDGFLVFAVGLFGVQRLEMWLRGSKLLNEARAAKASAPAPSPLAGEGGAKAPDEGSRENQRVTSYPRVASPPSHGDRDRNRSTS